MRRITRAVSTVALSATVLTVVPRLAEAATVDRIAGADRTATAAAISAGTFAPDVPVAFVATATDFPDALGAGVAAGIGGGPVLLTAPDRLSTAARSELERLRPSRIVVVGGGSSVGDPVADSLRAIAPVERISGPNRFATAAAVSAATFDTADEVYVAAGGRFPDALAAVPAAVRAGAPLLLVQRDSVPTSTASEIERLGATSAVVLGGSAAVGDGTVSALGALGLSTHRVAGATRAETAVEISRRTFPGGAGAVHVATGRTFADALAVGPVAASVPGPVLLAETNCVPAVVTDEIARLGADRIVLLGGERALGPGVAEPQRCPSSGPLPADPHAALATIPAWDADAPDPHVVRFEGRWYAYTTGTTWGNNLGVLTSDRPDGGWRTLTGQPWGSTALAGVPGWQVPDTQWAPGVFRVDGRYVLFYAAQSRATQEWCLSVATSPTPSGPFTDSTFWPTLCLDHLGGVIDPHPFLAADGTPWLHFKNNDGFASPTRGTGDVSRVFAVRLSADGTSPTGSVREVLVKDTSRFPWQTTVDNPQMVLRGGQHFLFHTGGNYVGDGSYATGVARCAGPTGPCETDPDPLTTSGGSVAGPGGGTVARDEAGRWWLSYHAWTTGCTSYTCGGARKLYVVPLGF